MRNVNWRQWAGERAVSLLIAVLAGGVFLLVISALFRHFWNGSIFDYGAEFTWGILAIGLLPMLFGKYLFGGIFLLSDVVGFFVDYGISSELARRGTPNMSGGFAWFFCLCLGFLLGFLAEYVLHLCKKRSQATGAKPPL